MMVTIFMEILVVILVIMIVKITIVIIMFIMVPGTLCGGVVTATSRCRRCRSRARRRT